ncbi:MAG: hypothetical protein NT128_04080 [Proteobacteria bacterium]|nr:hypothetical protein [Pseudomonadota bacterium]
MMSFGAYLQPDSGGYIDASPHRGLLYPLFLRACFNSNLNVVVAFQLLSGLFSCFYVITCIDKFIEQRLGVFTQLGLFMALSMPYLGHTLIGNTILTEPLCYPIFLLFFCNLLLWREFGNFKHFLISVSLGFALMLTRKQFGYVFATFYIGIFLDLLRIKKINWREVLVPFMVFALALGFEKSYMYFKTGHFISTPSGSFIIATPLYIAKANDVDLLKTNEQKQFLRNAIKERNRQKLAMYQEDFGNFSWPYHKKFEVINDVLRYEITSKALMDLNLNLDLIESEKLLSEVTWTVLKNNFSDFLKFYYHNIINNMGGYYYFFLICCAFLVCLWQLVLGQNSFLMNFGLMITSLQFLNFGAVAIFLPVLRRFAIYSEGLMICFWLLCLHQVIVRKKYD